jgi:25S rRNA (uracil2843-N3)-methyltransferase
MKKFVRQAKSAKKHPVQSSDTPHHAPIPVPQNPSQRPGWKGPSYVRKVPKPAPRPTPSSKNSESPIADQIIPVEQQQVLLNVFRNAFPASADFEALKPTLQEVKNALFERDFARAFGKEEYLDAYSCRWSPSRCLCYSYVIADLVKEFEDEDVVRRILGLQEKDMDEDEESIEDVALASTSAANGTSQNGQRVARIVCFGGGAAEVVAVAGAVRYLHPTAMGKPAQISEETSITESLKSLTVMDCQTQPNVDLLLVDTAAWGDVISKLNTTITSPPPLSKYASATAKASNASLLAPGILNTSFTQQDILEASIDNLGTLIGADPTLLTLLFTLNELYTHSISLATAFLLNITRLAPKGSLLLVVDSPGSYSETTVGKDGEKKKYPMHWLMDHTLLEKHSKRGEQDTPAWEKLVGDESRWFRLDEGLRYPISLENMRFQVHLFKRL